MVQNLKLFKLVDGVQSPFPNVDSQVEIFDYTYNAKRMGGTPSITATVMFSSCLDDVWDETVHTIFNDEKYFLKQTPTSSKDNNDARYKHEAEFVSERVILDNVYFYDVVSEQYEADKPVSNSSKVAFFGTIHEFVKRMNESLKYSKLQTVVDGEVQGYQVVVDMDIESEGRLITFEDQFFSGVLQEIFNVYELPYYFEGKTIHIGFEQAAINHTFEYGATNELLSITKTNANNRVVNRIAGVGSADNVPYYYPNESEKGDITAKYYSASGNERQNAVAIEDPQKYSSLFDFNESLVYKQRGVSGTTITNASIIMGHYNSSDEFRGTKINEYTANTTAKFMHPWVDAFAFIKLTLDFEVSDDPSDRTVIRIKLSNDKSATTQLPYDKLAKTEGVILENTSEAIKDYYVEETQDGWINIIIKNLLGGKYYITYKFSAWRIYKYENNGSVATVSPFKFNFNSDSIPDYAWRHNRLLMWVYDLSEVGLKLLNGYTPVVGDYIKQIQSKYVNTQETIMPSIYRDTDGAERFYNATNYSNQGQNLLLDSGKAIETKDYLLGQYDLGKRKPKTGDIVTLSFSGYMGAGHGKFKIFNSGGYVYLTPITYQNNYNTATGRYSVTFQWIDVDANGKVADNTFINIYQTDIDGNRIDQGAYENPNRIASKVFDIKLEIGDTATPYSEYDKVLDVYIDEETGEFYEFANPYVDGYPKEVAVEFAEIKPTIVGMKNDAGFPIDIFSEFAYDEDDNDETEEIEGTLYYKHPMFFGKLRKFDGPNGFNLFDSAIENGEMEISLTSGYCGGCKFTIQVSDDDLNQNLVQVYEANEYDENGNLTHAKGTLKRDENGNVICGRGPYQPSVSGQACQQDTRNNEVWVALKKDIDTFGVLMPVASQKNESGVVTHQGIKPLAYSEDADGTKRGDTFVILNILLPKGYITAAEEKLSKEIIKYLKENNEEKFTFSIKLSRIFLAENPSIVQQLNENSLINVIYNNNTYPLYVSSYSYKVSHSETLPEISVELSDEITVSEDRLTSTITEIKGDIKNAFTNIDIIGLASPYFLRKDVDDRSKGKIAASMGLEAGGYTKGRSGAFIDEYGQAEFESVAVRDSIAANSVSSEMFTTKDFVRGILDGKGGRFWVDESGKANIEVDNITARQNLRVTEIVVQKVNSVGGELIVSAANGQIKDVVSNYKNVNGALEIDTVTLTFNEDAAFMNNDIIRCSYWDNNENKLRSYWVVATVEGDMPSNIVTINYADLDAYGAELPRVGDKVAQMGNTTNTERQGIIVISTENSKPFISIYDGVNTTQLKKENIRGKFGDLTGITFGNEDLSGYGIWSDNAYLKGELKIASTDRTIQEEISLQIKEDASDRNYARDTANEIRIQDISYGTNVISTLYDVYGFTNDDTLTISFDWEATGIDFVEQGSYIIMQFDEVYGYLGTGFRLTADNVTPDIVTKGTYSKTITIKGKFDNSSNTDSLPIYKAEKAQLYLRFDNVQIASGYIKISNLRINKGSISHDWQPALEDANTQLEEYKKVVADDIEYLQSQIDGRVESWFYDYTPTLENYPANEWTTDELKESHIGDTFTNTQEFVDDETTPNAGKSWRWLNKDGVYDWYIIADTDATKALELASKAQDTADGKRRVFVKQPTLADAYDKGDLWVNATYGDYTNELLRCNTPKIKGNSFSIDHWELASKYTDDTTANNVSEELTSYKKEVSSKFEVTNGNFTSLQTEVTTKINNNANAGRNLLLGTNQGIANWNLITSLDKPTYYTITDTLYNDAKGVVFTKLDPSAYSQWEVFFYELRPQFIVQGKTYHLSFDAKFSNIDTSKTKLVIRVVNTSATAGLELTNPQSLDITIDSEWQHYNIEMVATKTGEISGPQVLYLGIFNSPTTTWGSVSFANLKLEQSTVATPWSPAPEDAKESIDDTAKVLQSEIKQTADSISLKISESEYYTATNLIVDSYVKNENKDYLLAKYSLAAVKPKDGDTVTLSFSGKIGDYQNQLKIFNSGGYVIMTSVYQDNYNPETERYERTFQWKSQDANGVIADNSQLFIYQGINANDAVNFVEPSVIYDVMLTRTDKAVPYKSSVSDVQNKLVATGINIESKKIEVTADDFTITNNNGEVTASADQYGNWSTNALRTLNSDFSLAITANYNNDKSLKFYYPNTNVVQMEMGWDEESESLMRYYDSDGKMLWKIGSARGFAEPTFQEWEVIGLYKLNPTRWDFTAEDARENETLLFKFSEVREVHLENYYRKNVVNGEPRVYETKSDVNTVINGWFTPNSDWTETEGDMKWRILEYYENGYFVDGMTVLWSSNNNVWIG